MEVGSAGENSSLPNLNTNYSTGVWNDGGAQQNASNRTSDDNFLSPHEWQIVTMVSTAVVLGLVILATIIGESLESFFWKIFCFFFCDCDFNLRYGKTKAQFMDTI